MLLECSNSVLPIGITKDSSNLILVGPHQVCDRIPNLIRYMGWKGDGGEGDMENMITVSFKVHFKFKFLSSKN